MKMLGQDILTQTEFDEHMSKQFTPLTEKVSANENCCNDQYDILRKQQFKLSIATGVALVIGVIALVSTLVS